MALSSGADSPLYMDHEHISIITTAVIVAMVGGFVRWLRKNGPHRWGQLFVSMVTAGFVGLLSHYVTHWLDLDVHLQFAISGVAGYGGGVFLDDVVSRVRGIINNSADAVEKLKDAKK